ncbi:hypothetical protein H5410_005807 [Solanum commersonii]|uniref:Uncharacterized protein n=1 Tax=Solanum commersonii TaxID=4109 RepID=A0A9J6A7M6_SOLCO|nr:hypothetical protein H5410_005807 [Solanum commersonii]
MCLILLDFWYEVNAFISPRLNQLHISDTGGSCVVPLIRVPQNVMHLSVMQIVKGFKTGEPTFLAALVGGIRDLIEAVVLPPYIEKSEANSYCDSTGLKRHANYISALGDNLKTLACISYCKEFTCVKEHLEKYKENWPLPPKLALLFADCVWIVLDVIAAAL